MIHAKDSHLLKVKIVSTLHVLGGCGGSPDDQLDQEFQYKFHDQIDRIV